MESGKNMSLRWFLAYQKIKSLWKKCILGHPIARATSYCLLLLWYETDAVVSFCAVTKLYFWLPSFCLVLWRWGWPVNDWNVFLLPLVYLWDCVLQHGGSGKKRTLSSWSMQPLHPLNSTDPETIPFDQRLGRRIFPPVNLGQSNLRLFKFLASPLQTSNFGQCGTASSVVQKESPCSFFAATLHNFSYKQVCSPHTMRVQAQGEQLHQAYLVIPCTVIYPHVLWTAFCYCDQWLRPRTVCQCTDALLCSSVYCHRIDAVQDSMSGGWMQTLKQNSGSHKHLSQYHVLMWMHYCRLCILNLCGCCMCYTVFKKNRRFAGFNEWWMNADAEAE